MRRDPESTLIVTSGPAGAWYEDGFDAVAVPSRVWALTDTRNDHLDRDIDEVRRGVERHGGYVVFTYGSVLFGPHLVSEPTLVKRPGLREVATTGDGRVYELPGTNH